MEHDEVSDCGDVYAVEHRWLRAHVEKCMRELWDDAPVHFDDDGDIPFRAGTAAVWVSVRSREPRLQVFAHAAHGVKPTALVLRELNEVCGRSLFAKVHLVAGVVMVEAVVPAEGVSARTLRMAIDAVASVANDLGVMVATVFGGATPFEDESEAAQQRGVDEEGS
ncbi:MAG TPA: YbjN domain-containing protein [Nocardioidaceae bacterium]|nr:YbjN domain-containing protein [Nocardioidaceae bacterium]